MSINVIEEHLKRIEEDCYGLEHLPEIADILFHVEKIRELIRNA